MPPTDTLETTLETQPADVEYWERIYNMQPASLVVTRTNDSDFKDRQLVIYLDGEKLGDLMFGDSMDREILPCPHRLRVSNTLVWKTMQFEAKPGEQIRFEAINRAGPLTYPMLVIFGAGPLYLTLKRVS